MFCWNDDRAGGDEQEEVQSQLRIIVGGKLFGDVDLLTPKSPAVAGLAFATFSTLLSTRPLQLAPLSLLLSLPVYLCLLLAETTVTYAAMATPRVRAASAVSYSRCTR